MDVSKVLDDLLVIIVLFRQTPAESAAFRSLQAIRTDCLLPDIFVYDNSPDAAPAAHGYHYVHDPSNGGVSRAYNRGAIYATSRKKQWMLLLDQDTTVLPGLFEAWAAARNRHPDSVAFVPVMKDARGIVSPFALWMGAGRRINVAQDRFPLATHRFINSGLFIKAEAFENAGGYDEALPLDFSDISFGHRLKVTTDHFCVIDFQLPHRLSGTEKQTLAEAVARFRCYCRGAIAIGKSSNRRTLYLLRTFARAFHLASKYSTFTFVKMAFREAYHR